LLLTFVLHGVTAVELLIIQNKKLEKAQGSGEKLLAQMQENERGIIQKWIERLEDNASLEAQQAYCQGYVDCILLLSGMGLLGTELSGEEILERIRK
jgi:hypothetical protein